ncbi:MAG TPA: response regulator [Pelolinea sp.]|nr:response regulator [Pelolinea sp.]
MPKTRVILADDHAIVRAGFRKMIEQTPGLVVVSEIGNGPQVFEALKREPADLLIIDVTMPDFEPISAIRKIRADYPDLKILVVSAYDDDYYVKGLLNAGVNGYHLKDQSLLDLKLAIERVLEGQRWISSALINKLVISPNEKEMLPDLTDRQREMLRLLQQGCDNKSIAQQMGLSVKTVENHLTRLYRRLDVRSRLEAVNYLARFPQVLGTPGLRAAQTTQQLSLDIEKSAAILVVDDNTRYRKHLMRMIGKAYPRAVIYEAESVKETLNLAERVGFQLALVDVILGESNGIACVRQLHTIQPLTRIILISAYPDREFHRQGLESGAAAFLDKKNLDLPTLRQVIDDVIAQ